MHDFRLDVSVTAPVLNLDTNHLSDLVRRSDDADVTDVMRLLERADAWLGLSLFQIAQVAAPSFTEWSELRALLENVPTLLLQPQDDVFADEVRCAVARATGRSRRPPRVFARDTADWGDRPGPVGGGPVDLAEFFRMRGDHRESLGIWRSTGWGSPP